MQFSDREKFLVLFIVLGLFALGYFCGLKQAPTAPDFDDFGSNELPENSEVDFSLFWKAWDVVEEKYVNKVDRQAMVYGSIKGMVESLEDPYSTFLTPKQSKQFLQDMQGSFEGIGAEIGVRQGQLTVISPLEGMPAQKAGLKAGDIIIKIEEEPTLQMSLTEAVRNIRGPKGEPVSLIILRGTEKKKISIVRDKIDLLSVQWETKPNNIALIDINNFQQDSAQEFSIAAGQILLQQPQGIILDLRNNPGGYLQTAVKIAGWFIDKGKVVAIENFGTKRENKKYYSPGPAQFANKKVVVLANKGSASASEILAGALRDVRGIKIIGEQTFGKGSVQELKTLEDNSNLKISIAKWLTPSGVYIEEQGLNPDIEIVDKESTPQDEVIEKALEFLIK